MIDSFAARPKACPACGARSSEPLYLDLRDDTFKTSSEKWQVDRCRACGSAFLNPTPTPEQLAQAYSNYYTHVGPNFSREPKPTSWIQRLSREYRDFRFLGKRSWLGAMASALPPLRQRVDLRNRFLPPVRPGCAVLDIGCGPGLFLQLASSLGWKAKGIDFDPDVVSFGRKHGLDISTDSLEDVAAAGDRFDAVTLSEVIEHLPDPLETLHGIRHVLRPGGFLFLSTPNATGRGHRRFGKLWRGLEVPRHIVVFSERALREAVVSAGFENVRLHKNPEADWQLYMKSWLLSQGRRPYDTGLIPRRDRLRLLLQSIADHGERDALILTARRPTADRGGAS